MLLLNYYYYYKTDSSFAVLEVTQSFTPDIMHDLLEGVIPLLIKLVFQSLHSSNIITVVRINDAIAFFSFCKNDKKNQPVPLPTDDSFRRWVSFR